jgi:hypothetical protein
MPLKGGITPLFRNPPGANYDRSRTGIPGSNEMTDMTLIEGPSAWSHRRRRA